MSGNSLPQNRSIPYHQAPAAHQQQQNVSISSRNMAVLNGSGGSNAQGRAINKMLLEIVRDRVIDPQRLHLAIETFVDRMDCVNLATLLFHTGKKRFLLAPIHVKLIADRLNVLNEELRAREASNSLYGLKCLSSEIPEVRDLVYALATKITLSASDFVAQAVGNALYGLQMMSSEYEEVRFLLLVLSGKISQCTEQLEAQNVGNALYGLRGMNSDYKEVRAVVAALTPKVARAKEELNGQALGNSLYGLQNMSSKETEVRGLLTILATKVARTWEELKAQEVGNALYGLKRMSSDVSEVRTLIAALVPKIASSPDLLDAQAIGNSFYGLQNMKSDNTELLALLNVLAEKVNISNPELDGQAMGNSLYGLQGMSSEFPEVRSAISALTMKIQGSMLEMNAQELGNALYGLQNMTSMYKEVRRLLLALAQKISLSKHELTSQEIGNSLFGLQGMSSDYSETRILLSHLSMKIGQSHSALDPQGVSNTLFGLQHLSSESHEVRTLLHAVTQKIEHCWKVLSAHHVAHACFGLQSLSSEHPEVRALLKGFVSKVATCREEMSAKQLSVSFFGLQNMNGNLPESRALLTALVEKLSVSHDIWGPQHVALAMFGLQGFNSEYEEVSVALSLLNFKASSLNMMELEPAMLGNWLFGMQRMSTSNREVTQLLSLLTPVLKTFVSQPERFTPLVCANMIFGVQGCSCALESVQLVLDVVIAHVQACTDVLRKRSPRKSSANELFQEYVTLSQAMCLALSVIPDLVVGEELHLRCVKCLADMERTIADLLDFFVPRPLSTAEIHAVKELQEHVRSDAVKVKYASLGLGFENAIALETTGSPLRSGETKMVIEVIGTSYCYPAKELFYHLKRQYLEQAKGVIVKTLPAQSFVHASQQGLGHHPDVLSAVRALLDEHGMFGAIGSNKGLDISVAPSFDFTATNASMRVFDGHATYLSTPFTEYYDDELRFAVNQSAEEPALPRHRFYHRRAFGMHMGWLGEWPLLSSLHSSSQVSQQILRYAAAASNSSPTAPVRAYMSMSASSPASAGIPQVRPLLLEQRGMIPSAADLHERLSSSSSVFGKLGGSSDSTLFLEGSETKSTASNRNAHLSHTFDEQDNLGASPSNDGTLNAAMLAGMGKSFEAPLSRAVLALSASSASQPSSFYQQHFGIGPAATASLDGFGAPIGHEYVVHGPALEVDVLAPVSSSPPRSQETPQRRGTGQSNDSSSLQSAASMAMKQSPNLVVGAHGASASYSLPPGLH